MNKVTCPTCGATMVECRRYRLEPLAQFMRMTMSATCIEVRISGKSQQQAFCHGVTRRVVDRIAAELKEHPAIIWPEVIDHDIEDTTKVCDADDCETRFVPRNRAAKYCSKRCLARVKQRRYRATPAGRAANLRAKRAYVAACADYVAKQRRAYYEANKDRLLAQQAAWREANREHHRAYQRAYRARQKKAA